MIAEYSDSGTGVSPVAVSSGLNLDSLQITLDGQDVTTNFYRFARGAVGKGSNLVAGSHPWSASIADYAGNVTSVSNTFIAICAMNTTAPVDDDNYYWEESWAGSELVRMPLHDPPGTLVLFTFGGVDYGPRPPGVPRDMSQVSWKGLAPVAWNNGDGINLGTVSYLLTVTGGDYLEINPLDFSWPAGGWSSSTNTPCGGVSETSVTDGWLKFDGFYNERADVAVNIEGPDKLISTSAAAGLPITLIAHGSPEGGAFQWSTSSSKIKLVGSTSDPSVTVSPIKGQFSDPNGSETVTVVYTYHGKSATATHNIFVQKPSSLSETSKTPKLKEGKIYLELWYQILDQKGDPLREVIPFGAGTVRLANLLVSEHLIWQCGTYCSAAQEDSINYGVRDDGTFSDTQGAPTSCPSYTRLQAMLVGIAPYAAQNLVGRYCIFFHGDSFDVRPQTGSTLSCCP